MLKGGEAYYSKDLNYMHKTSNCTLWQDSIYITVLFCTMLHWCSRVLQIFVVFSREKDSFSYIMFIPPLYKLYYINAQLLRCSYRSLYGVNKGMWLVKQKPTYSVFLYMHGMLSPSFLQVQFWFFKSVILLNKYLLFSSCVFSSSLASALIFISQVFFIFNQPYLRLFLSRFLYVCVSMRTCSLFSLYTSQIYLLLIS